MRNVLQFLALIAVSTALYLIMCLGSWFATWFASQWFGLLVVPVGIWLVVKIVKAAYSNEGEN